MKKVLIIVYTAFAIILLANFIYYKNLYNKQIDYITALLDRQVQIVGLSVDETNNLFLSDLNQIAFSEDLAMFFEDNGTQAKDKLKLFFSKYEDFVTGIKLYDNKRNEYTLKKDESGEWLEQPFILHVQGDIYDRDQLVTDNRKFYYYQPIIKDNVTIGNIVLTVDYQRYFNAIFSVFNMKDYQWQWVVSDSSTIIYDNFGTRVVYKQIEKISLALEDGSVGNIIHKALIEGKNKEVISSYYSTQLLRRDLCLIFSAPTGFFQKYIIRNSVFIVIGTLILIQVIIMIFWRFIKYQKSETSRLSESERMLFKLIEEMPVGVIIHNKQREIMKANKVAASQYSYPGEEEMVGKIFPETSISEVSEYFAKNLGGAFDPELFVIIKKEIGEMVLYRNIIPVVFMGEEATMEILIDITMLESARKQEAKANVAKSEFLARMSYEIRTPLNGIIGMTDILNKNDLSPAVQEIVSLLRRSTEVLLKIINDILDFSKIETGKMILDEIPFNLREEINYCSDLAKTYLADKLVVFTSNVDENIPERIITDQFRLRQVLTNLISHSASHTETGEIKLFCRLSSSKNGIIILGFELLDTGLAFDKASLKKIFGDFVNVESKVVKSNDDSEFGTILSKQLIELMGGELIAESPSGIAGDKGTKIRFTIQAYSNERKVKNISQENVQSVKDIKTLVITGQQNRDEEILGCLHKIGLSISVTSFQKSTVGQIKANLSLKSDRYGMLILVDEVVFNGFDVAQAIWENNISGNVIIVMISSNDQKGNYMKCLTLGVDHYIVKPFDTTELLGAVKDSFPNIESGTSSPDINNAKEDLKILVVEDNKMNQKVIVTMLKSLGYTCDVADDGYAGYLQAKNQKYNLIFMDLIMPEMNGFDSARKILALDKDVLIVAFTADNMPEAKRKAELSGIKEFIAKPLRIEELKKLFTQYFKK